MDLSREIACGFRKYEARNNDLAHLAANILVLLATVWEAELIAGESLKSLRSTGHGRSVKGRWVRWRNNSQIRGELWRCLRYKCHLLGLRLVWQYPKGTTHTCPHCGKPVRTYVDPSLDSKPSASGAWLRCFACGWNGARDYAAAINIALLGVTFLKQNHETKRTDLLRKDVRERLDQICHPAFRFVPRNPPTLMRVADSWYSLINRDVLLSNGSSRYRVNSALHP